MVDIEVIPKSIDGIYSSLNSIIKVLQREYNLNEEIVEAIAKIAVEDVYDNLDSYDSNISLFDFEKKIIEYVQEYIKKQLEDGNFEILDQYINKDQVLSDSYNMLINRLKKISSFLKKIDYPLTLDICINLINNCAGLKILLNRIINIKEDLISKINLKEIFDDEIAELFIEGYCKINNIKVKNSIPIRKKIESEYPEDLLGMYLLEIDKPLLSIEEERYLAYEKMLGNEEVKKEFIERNLRLVVSIAKRYKNRGLSMLDLIQEGNLGLIEAVNHYDVTKECRFSTYAKWWIRKGITTAIYNKGRMIRIPIHKQENLRKVISLKEKLEVTLNKEVTAKEITKTLNISLEEAIQLVNLFYDTTSLNEISDDDMTTIEDRIAYIDNDLDNAILKCDLKYLLEKSNLTEKEINILTLRYGLDGNNPLTLTEIGNIYGVGRNYIGQVEKRVISKIRRRCNIKEKSYN